jgi:SAM-dependent methyltransferase
MGHTSEDKQSFTCWYFNKLGLQPSADSEEFLDYLTDAYGEAVVNELLSILEQKANNDSKENEEKLYDFKNQTLAFSLDFARYSANLYGQFLTWFLEQKFTPPGRLLDLGCDNGITTCFFGLLFPDSEVVGVDICNNAVSCAKALALHLGIKNIQFINADFTDSNQSYKPGNFDMIVSLRSLQEIYGYFPVEPLWPADSQSLTTLSTYLRSFSIPKQFAGISAITGSLHDQESTFITCERILGLDQFVFFAETLRRFGMDIDFSKSSLVRFHELGQAQEMPALIAKKKGSNQPLFEAISRFYRRGQNIILEPGYEYEGPVAQLVFTEFAHKQLLDSIKVTDGYESVMHYELWQSGKLLLRYQYRKSGYWGLHILPIDSLSIAKKGLRMIAAMNN